MARDDLAIKAKALISRRGLIRGIGGAAGLVAFGGLRTPALANDDDDEEKRAGPACAIPMPIPHEEHLPFGFAQDGVHFYFPGPVDGSAFPTDPFGAHPEGRDPSTVGNFSGVLGQVDLQFHGTGRDTTTGQTADYTFHTDTRFFSGDWIASDQHKQSGTLAFI